MILTQTGLVFMGLLVIITGVQGKTTSMCALLGSSVNLTCSAGNPASRILWFTVTGSEYQVENTEIQEGNRVSYNMSENNQPLLTIKDVRISDENSYCCSEDPDLCWDNRVHLRVTDLQVKVIPATDGETVTLMCSPGCPLAEPNATYIWYRNGAFLYEDWSPWYQQLVSNDSAVRYSCAVKGAEHLRAPEVSVDSVTSTCFSVSYAKGRMCLYTNSSEDEPCSITYPRDLQIKRTGGGRESDILTCDSSCPESNLLYVWYKYGIFHDGSVDFILLHEGRTCAVRGHEDLLSPDFYETVALFCIDETHCWSVTYVSWRICALEGSSVTITSQYLSPYFIWPGYLFWSRMNAGGVESAEKLIDGADRVEYQNNVTNQHMLTITDLRKNDSAEYRFIILSEGHRYDPEIPGVTVVVTDLNVKIAPSSDVTRGQTVTLTCSSSCPLTDDKNYVWFLNTQPLTLPNDQNKKHLVIDKVTTDHAGDYACAVASQTVIRSPERTLTVSGVSVAIGVRAAFVVLIPLIVIFWILRKKSSTQPPRAETSIHMDQLNPESVDDVPDADPEQEDIL